MEYVVMVIVVVGVVYLFLGEMMEEDKLVALVRKCFNRRGGKR